MRKQQCMYSVLFLVSLLVICNHCVLSDRMRLLASQAAGETTKSTTRSTTTASTTSSSSTSGTSFETSKSTRRFDRFTADSSSSTRARPTPPMAPPTMTASTEFSTTTLEEEDISGVPSSSMASRATTYGFYTATKPSAFLDPECRDMRWVFSAFWRSLWVFQVFLWLLAEEQQASVRGAAVFHACSMCIHL